VVGLPEEALFRGYVQTRLVDVLPATVTVRRIRIPWLAIVVQAALFGLVHFAVDLDPSRLSVFFPGLLFGVIRSARGGIGAAVFFHAFCNLYSDVLVRGWL
jgi:membrane protease YdiL (CAAX protease family)